MKALILIGSLLLLFVSTAMGTIPVETTFTYQGELTEAGEPANGSFDMQFDLFDAVTEGGLKGSVQTLVNVSDGIFTVELDYGINVFDGTRLWLEIIIDPTNPEAVILTPRQKLTATPYALQALSVAPGSIGATQVNSSQVQLRIEPGCGQGEFIQEINPDGTPFCAPDQTGGGGGTVTEVNSGNGLSGGPITTSGTLSVDDSVIQRRLTGGCPEGEYIRSIDQAGDPTCSADTSGGASGLCPSGLVMVGINGDGSLVCHAPPKTHLVSIVNESGSFSPGFTMELALGSDGFPVIAARDNSTSDVVVFKCNDVACTGDDDTISTISTASPGVVDIVIASDGYPVISFYDLVADGLFLVKCNDVACAGGDDPVNTVDDPANDVGDANSIAIGTDGYPVISYNDFTDGHLKVAKCSDADCSGAKTISILNSDHTDTRSTSIAIGVDGFPVIAFRGGSVGTGFGLWVAKCNDAACTGNDEALTFIDSANPASDVSIALGTDGLPVISYVGPSSLDLKVAKCNDAACTGDDETLSTVDDQINDLGLSNSIAIGKDGFPVITYFENTAWDTKVAKCNDVACLGGDETTTTVDSANQVGRFADIAVGEDGLPVLIYEEFTVGKIKVVRCGTSDCRN